MALCCRSTRFGTEAAATRWDSAAMRKLRDTLYLRKISPAAFLRQCDANKDGRVSGAEMQRTFMGFVEGLSNAEAAELVRSIAGENGSPDLNKLYEQLTRNPTGGAGSEERLLAKVRKQLLSLPGGAEQAIAAAFKSFDTDGDGTLSREEFRRGIASLELGIGVDEIDRLLELADENGDGELEYEEFVDRILRRQSEPHDELRHWKRQLQLAIQPKTLREIFTEWDRNGTKRLSLNELKRGMLSLPVFKRLKLREVDIEKLFMAADSSKVGYLTRERFIRYFTGTAVGMELSPHLPPTVLLQNNTPWGGDPLPAGMAEAAVKHAAQEGRQDYTALTLDPMQRLRDRLFERRVTSTEVFRAFDADRDGFVSRDDFIAGCTGSSHTVHRCLKDMKELGLSGPVASKLFDDIEGSKRGYVELAAFQRALSEPPPTQGWEAKVVATVQTVLDRAKIKVETLFQEWNAPKDGRLTAAQFGSGCRRAAVQTPMAQLAQMFRQLGTRTPSPDRLALQLNDVSVCRCA